MIRRFDTNTSTAAVDKCPHQLNCSTYNKGSSITLDVDPPIQATIQLIYYLARCCTYNDLCVLHPIIVTSMFKAFNFVWDVVLILVLALSWWLIDFFGKAPYRPIRKNVRSGAHKIRCNTYILKIFIITIIAIMMLCTANLTHISDFVFSRGTNFAVHRVSAGNQDTQLISEQMLYYGLAWPIQICLATQI